MPPAGAARVSAGGFAWLSCDGMGWPWHMNVSCVCDSCRLHCLILLLLQRCWLRSSECMSQLEYWGVGLSACYLMHLTAFEWQIALFMHVTVVLLLCGCCGRLKAHSPWHIWVGVVLLRLVPFLSWATPCDVLVTCDALGWVATCRAPTARIATD